MNDTQASVAGIITSAGVIAVAALFFGAVAARVFDTSTPDSVTGLDLQRAFYECLPSTPTFEQTAICTAAVYGGMYNGYQGNDTGF